jgi:hypothetical protein
MVVTTNTTHAVFASAFETSIKCLGGDFDCPDVYTVVDLSTYVAGTAATDDGGSTLALDETSGVLTFVCPFTR